MSTYEAWRITYQSSEAAARAAYNTVEKLHAELVELKEQMQAIGAGGVEPLRKSASQQAEAIQSMGGKYRVRWKHKNGQWSFWTSLGGGLKFGDVEVELVEAESPGDLVRSIRDYLGVHDGIKLGGHAMDDMALDLARIALRFQHLVAPPADPMDWPLPCDVTVGHGTMRKGVALRTLVLRMKVLYEMATGQNADEVAARTPEQRAELLSAFQAKIAPQAVQAAAVPEAIEQMAADRYKVVPSHESMFHRWAVVADNGAQQLYIGREGECQNMARKFMGAFLDGAFVAMQNAAPPHPTEGFPSSPEDALDADRWMGICKAIFGDEDHVLVPRGLIGAACYAIDKKRDGTKTLAELRRYTTGDLSAATQPAAQGMDAPWSDLKVAFDCDDTDVLWAALDAGSLIFPKGWELVETDGSCARSVTIFRVDHAPVTAEGIAVKAVIDAAIAAQAKQGGV